MAPIQLTRSEEEAFMLLRNSPDIYGNITQGKKDITITQLNNYFDSLATRLKLAQTRRNGTYIDVEKKEIS